MASMLKSLEFYRLIRGKVLYLTLDQLEITEYGTKYFIT